MPAVPDLRSTLEDAIAANFDDRAAHAAYADYLHEQGDPRGELIQVQLALEDPGCTGQARKALKEREQDLLGRHERAWLGPPLAQGLFDKRNGKEGHAFWNRGWLEEIYLWWLGLAEAHALATCPVARMLQRLEVRYVPWNGAADPEDGVPEGVDSPPSLYPLDRAPFLPQLRWLRVGEPVDHDEEVYSSTAHADGLVEVVARTRHLEELEVFAPRLDLAGLFKLTNLTRLRHLVLYHGREDHPLHLLADNPSFSALERLRIHPAHADQPSSGSFLRREEVVALLRSPHFPALRHLHLHASDLGDEGCDEIVSSGILGRLETLDLGYGCIQDEGASILAACPDIRRLKYLSLENNELTYPGRAFLHELGIEVHCNNQYFPGSDDFLGTGDME
jgi:uncharacterized protein (TIGR02996 family)